MTSTQQPGDATGDVDQGYQLAVRTWAGLLPAMANGRRVRLSRDGGRTYLARAERVVTGRLPAQPAALRTYDQNGSAPILCVDLDVSRGGVSAVERDLELLAALLERAGLVWFSDHSPNGGRHLYVPLAVPATFAEAKAVIRALAALAPTLDAQPMLNVDAGCIRPPGSWHRTGGHQALDGPLEAAQAAVRTPNPPTAWQALLDELWRSEAPVPGPATALDTAASADVDHVASGDLGERLAPLRGFSAPDEDYQAIARTGRYDPDRYRSASEARQGVWWACVASGWTFRDVVSRIEDGTWAGLAALYEHATTPRELRVREWRVALEFEKDRRGRAPQRSESKRSTRGTTETRRAAHGTHQPTRPRCSEQVQRHVYGWLSVVDHLTRRGLFTASQRETLQALAQVAILKDAVVVDFGTSSLAEAVGRNRSTVSRALVVLRDALDDVGLIDLVHPAAGVRADAYALIVPPQFDDLAQRGRRRGMIHAIRPAFRKLGNSAAFVYAAIENAEHGRVATRAEIAHLACVSDSTAQRALRELASHNMVVRAPRAGDHQAHWRLGPANLARLAEAWGVLDDVRAQHDHHRALREAWWAFLDIVRLKSPGAYRTPRPEPHQLVDITPRPPPPPGLYDDALSLLDLIDHLERERAYDDQSA